MQALRLTATWPVAHVAAAAVTGAVTPASVSAPGGSGALLVCSSVVSQV